MASSSPELSGPTGANLVVVLGFTVMFTTFATESAWSWILGGLLVVAGGLWAGFAGSGGEVAGGIVSTTVAVPDGTATNETGGGHDHHGTDAR